ncbi:S4 domain-containing protein YaaA [Ligilactobacillus salivarius]|uniref:S4 domain-containing protein YaaA n=1 Tax=Ligilactobacillus salivarius TaxID=1624 RepID=UPI001E4281B4|nr:S4 domain-containing protein YaaA [Ligilactobacillus salivarius]UHL92064.1 S4 domain-containing protein YaaA [Ligilactobacillus salivarius]
MAQKVKLKTDYITLGQLLKIVDIISSGGQAKWFLQENDVLINGELDNRRGRKLYPNDLVEIPEYGKVMMEADK